VVIIWECQTKRNWFSRLLTTGVWSSLTIVISLAGIGGESFRLQFVTMQRIFSGYHRGAFWRLLAALQIQLNRSPSSTPARQRFSLAWLFRFLHSRTTSRFDSASLWRDAKEVH
jgi:hypothetical protein